MKASHRSDYTAAIAAVLLVLLLSVATSHAAWAGQVDRSASAGGEIDGGALNEAIVTDRPDFVESSAVVGRGRVQIETSVAFERGGDDNSASRATATPTLLRVGLGEAFELRLETDGRVHRWSAGAGQGGAQDTSASGMADTALGLKWHVRDGGDGAGSAPALGLLLHADFASGARQLRGDGVRPSLRAVAEWELTDGVALGLMPGLASERDAQGRRFTSAIAGVVVGKEWTPRWRSFIELAAPRLARASHGGSLVSIDAGGAYLLSRQCQLDAALSAGLNRQTPALGLSFGLSVKL